MVMNEVDAGLWTGTSSVVFCMVGSLPEPTIPDLVGSPW